MEGKVMETFTFRWNNINWYMVYDTDGQEDESPNVSLMDFEDEEGSIIGAFIETSWLNSKTLLEIKSEALIYLQEEIWPMKWQDWDIDYADFRYHQ
jgi:hypothetical protein